LTSFEDELVSQRVVLNIGDDLEVLSTFPDHYFDWLYLDTTHSYEQTKKELDLLKIKVKIDGLILGNDWKPGDPNGQHYGLFQAIQEFLLNEPYELIYGNENDCQRAIRRTPPNSDYSLLCSMNKINIDHYADVFGITGTEKS
jgi:hypothetical protein